MAVIAAVCKACSIDGDPVVVLRISLVRELVRVSFTHRARILLATRSTLIAA